MNRNRNHFGYVAVVLPACMYGLSLNGDPGLRLLFRFYADGIVSHYVIGKQKHKITTKVL